MADRGEGSPARLEAISDGVFAVILTIMVLELHAPADASPQAVLALWPQFAAYLVSFAFVATYWVNHRYLFGRLKRVGERVLWSNMALLFLLSLVPFATAYVGETRLAPFPAAFYALVMLLNAIAYGVVAMGVEQQETPASRPPSYRFWVRAMGYIAAAVYAGAVIAGLFNAGLSLAMIFAVTLYYMTPLPRPS